MIYIIVFGILLVSVYLAINFLYMKRINTSFFLSKKVEKKYVKKTMTIEKSRIAIFIKNFMLVLFPISVFNFTFFGFQFLTSNIVILLLIAGGFSLLIITFTIIINSKDTDLLPLFYWLIYIFLTISLIGFSLFAYFHWVWWIGNYISIFLFLLVSLSLNFIDKKKYFFILDEDSFSLFSFVFSLVGAALNSIVLWMMLWIWWAALILGVLIIIVILVAIYIISEYYF